MLLKQCFLLPLPPVKVTDTYAMTTNFNIQNTTAGKESVKAIIACSQIVFIVDGRDNCFPEA